jgi:hypothetical protein
MTVLSRPLPTKAEQPRYPYGPDTVYARRPTTTRYLGIGPLTPLLLYRMLSTQTEDSAAA